MGRIFSLMLSTVGIVTGFAAAAWWFNTIVISLTLRWAESRRPLQRGSLPACAAVLFGLWILFAAGSASLAVAIFLMSRHWLGTMLWNTLPESLSRFGYGAVLAGLALVILVGVLAGYTEVKGAWGAAKRRRFLEDLDTPLQPVDLPPRAGEGRRIVILCDGTSNRPDETEDGESSATNIWKLAQALVADETQTIFYQAGVGSDTSTTAKQARQTRRLLSATGGKTSSKIAAWWTMLIKLIEAGTGVGISETIVNGYREIVRQYQPGDRIYLVGFSRGAFAARCIAGVIYRCGLLRSDYLRFAPDMVQIYRTRPDPDRDAKIRADMIHTKAPSPDGGGVTIEFLGVFDTVASLGFPLWGWWFRVLPIWKNRAFATDPAAVCKAVYHALAMDERRAQFFPTLFTVPMVDGKPSPRVRQVWFRGAHADIGGGYARRDLSDITLAWMAEAMNQHGLKFHKDQPAVAPNGLGPVHDELERAPWWQTFGTWPRWHPAPGGTDPTGYATLHSTVLDRARDVEQKIDRLDLRQLGLGEEVEFVVDINRDWYRTGIIIETNKHYRITYLGGKIRDGECPSCTPHGQFAGWLDPRRLLGFGRRIPNCEWMLLCATIAHPREWMPKEKPFWVALRYLMTSAPRELRAQIATIGEHLGARDDYICLTSAAPSGLLHLFANDWWQTNSNNSGGPRLRITRIATADAAVPLWSLSEDGTCWIKGLPLQPSAAEGVDGRH